MAAVSAMGITKVHDGLPFSPATPTYNHKMMDKISILEKTGYSF